MNAEFFSTIQYLVEHLATQGCMNSTKAIELLDLYYTQLCEFQPVKASIANATTLDIGTLYERISTWAHDNRAIKPSEVEKEWKRRIAKKDQLEEALKLRIPHMDPAIDIKMLASQKKKIELAEESILEHEEEYPDLIQWFKEIDHLKKITVTTFEGGVKSIAELEAIVNEKRTANGHNQAEWALNFRERVRTHIRQVYNDTYVTGEDIGGDVGFNIGGVMLVVCASGKVPVEKINNLKEHDKRVIVLARTSKDVYGQDIIYPFNEALFRWRYNDSWNFTQLANVCKWLSTKDFSIPAVCKADITWVF